ncbi:O-antigen ligase family protein [Solimonas variicoloris]|uniref:O-antigen ligase family protein n=1 Tax=Solimonas variicoloris TaxID=254408 RepID=UPI000374A151|nr:O-antigen ligase family protein [Solimonas variicoloris]
MSTDSVLPLAGAPAVTAPAASRLSAARWVRDDRHRLLMSVLVWTFLILLIVPDGFDYASLLGTAPSSGSAGSRLLWMGLLGVSAAVILWRAGLAWLLLTQFNRFLLLFAVLAAASVLWSIAPAFTVRRLVRVATFLAVAVAYTLVAWDGRRFQDLLRPLITLVMFGSIAFALLRPDLGVHHEIEAGIAGSWRGLTSHKNTLGMLAGTGVLLWAHAALTRATRRLPMLIGLAACAFCLLMSKSSTSLLTVLFTVPLLLMLMRSPLALRPYMPWLVAAFSLLLVVYALAVLRLVPGLEWLLSPVAALTGKDLSFTGRSDIWQIVSEQVRRHPLLGSGYGAYWIGPTPMSPSYAFVPRLYFYPGSGHNGYLDVVNDLGSVGLLCLLGYLASYVVQALRLLRVEREQAALFLALFLQHAVSNFSESHWFSTLSVGFAIMMLATAALARSALEQRLRQVFGEPELATAARSSGARP